MINKDNEIKKLFDYSDLLVIKKSKKVLRDLDQDKENIANEMERRGLTNSGLLFKKLIDRDLEAVEKIVNYQVDCDLNKISVPLTKNISDKIYLRAKSLAKSRLNILDNMLKQYGRFWNKNENLIISMKRQCNNKIAEIMDNARLEIKIHQKKFEMEMSNPNKVKVIDDIVQNNQKKNKIEKNIKKPKIFLSYCHKDEEIADKVDNFFNSKNIKLTRDVRGAPAYTSLTKFMDTIRDHDYVIMLISDAYLKSTNCMYEVIQFIQEKKYIEKTFPIIIDKKADIFKKEKHIDYISFWQNKYKCFRDKINDLENTGTAQSHVELDKIDEIQLKIGKFLNKIADLNCFSLYKLESTNYKAILDKIGKTLGVFQKEEIEVESEKLKLRIIGCLYKWYVEGLEQGIISEFNIKKKINEWKVSSKLMNKLIDEMVDDGYLEWSTFGRVKLKKEGRLLARKEKLEHRYSYKQCGKGD